MHTALLAAALVATTASAQVTFVAHRPINLEPAQAEAFSAVCAQAYERASGQAVTTPAADAVAAAPTERVELSLIGLDGAQARRVLVTATRRAADGKPLHQASLEALSLDDAPTVCARLADALVQQLPVEATQTRTSVTAAEARASRRRTGRTNSFGVKSGLTAALAAGTTLSPMGSLAFDARFETDRLFTQLGAGFLVPGGLGTQSYGGLFVDLGASAYLTDGDLAPYVGAGLQPRLVFSGAGFNLVPWVQVGATLSRKAGTRFSVDARVGQNVLPTLYSYDTSYQPTQLRYPTELSLHATLGF